MNFSSFISILDSELYRTSDVQGNYKEKLLLGNMMPIKAVIFYSFLFEMHSVQDHIDMTRSF